MQYRKLADGLKGRKVKKKKKESIVDNEVKY